MLDHRSDLSALRGCVLAAFLSLLTACGNDAAPAEAGAPAGTPSPTPTPTPAPTPTPSPPPPVTQSPTPITSLPTLPSLTNVKATMNGGSAAITFDTVDAAVDYRVYELPSNDNIRLASDGSVIIPNATYRCAGTYQVPIAQVEDAYIQGHGIITRVTTPVDGYTRTLAEATLGYVYTTPDAVPGLIPVYAAGSALMGGDNNFFFRYQASRDKKYTTSYSEYTALVASGWRDDGIAFYVPAQAGTGTKAVVTPANLTNSIYDFRYHLVDGPELTKRSAGKSFATAFNILANPAAGTRPLMRVFYAPFTGRFHDELAIGQAGFKRILNQGLNNPAAELHYSGVTAPTTLVVEALDKGCPFQGIVSAQTSITTPADKSWYTIADIRKTAANGEVYINGQYDGVAGNPKAIARSFIDVAPRVRQAMDWLSTPASFSEQFTTLPCQAPDGNCFQQFHLQSSTYDISFLATETDRWKVGNVLGEFQVNYTDWATDTNGKFRMTVRNQKANIAANSFVHATMEVNSVSSGRRYPQLILSDQDIPVQYNLINGRSLILQTFGPYPPRIDLEICDHATWDVNQQCPRFIFRYRYDSSGAGKGINPIPEVDQYMATVDGSVKYDLYASNSRAYIFINDKPYGCANLTNNAGVSPAPLPPTGPVTVTFGDVLYHSGADGNFFGNMEGGFMHRHQQVSAHRHFDNLGFSSGVAAPAWDENRIPCSSKMTTLDYDPVP
jgi:hypothetical protein